MLATLAGLLPSVIAGTPKPDTAPLRYTVSWAGNSFSGKSAWVLQDVEDICVLPDGTLFTNVFWDEAGGNVQEYHNGSPVRVAGHTHGWGYGGGSAVAANSHYLFIVQSVDSEGGGLKGSSWPPKGFRWSGISRRRRDDIRQPAPFADGRGKEGDVLPGAFLPVAVVPERTLGDVRGVCASETELFVSSSLDDTIKVYDAETMRLLRAWPLPRPDKICLDHSGNLWALQRPQTDHDKWQAARFTPDGKPLPQQITLPGAVIPTAFCTDPQNRLLIADGGPANQIQIYTHADTSPQPAAPFGTFGGIFAASGVFGDRRFNRPHGVGADGEGNLYVASSGSTSGGSTMLECYAPDGSLKWRRFGLTFVDGADADSNAPDEVYTKEEHFTLTTGKDGTSGWLYRGYTVNPFRYPDDPRLHTSSTNAWVRHLHGQKLLFVTDMTAEALHVYRFHPATDGETAIPCALIVKRPLAAKTGYPRYQPATGEWMWLDRNGNGQMDADEFHSGGAESQGILWPDMEGTLWQANGGTIRALPLSGLDAKGVPAWDYKQARSYPKPPDLDEVRRLRYLPHQNIMLLGGNRGDDHNQHWKPMGPVLCLYDGWKTGKPTLRQKIVLPYEMGSSGHESAEPISFDVAGDYVFVAYTRGLKADGIQNAFVKILRLKDLAVVGNLSAEAALGETGLLDLVESVSAIKRADGGYEIFLEDDYKSKIVIFRWRP